MGKVVWVLIGHLTTLGVLVGGLAALHAYHIWAKNDFRELHKRLNEQMTQTCLGKSNENE